MPVVDHLPTSVRPLFKKAKRLASQPIGTYLSHRKKPLYKGLCLLEGGQGKNINGNMFVLARELAKTPELSSLRGVFVVTEDTVEAARERLKVYGIDMPVVDRASKEYQIYLARCEFLFTDNSFPPYFDKRPEQVYVNTWHGTPLKQLGRSNIENSLRSLANVQKNMLTADYLLFPNELTKSCFFDDYMIGRIFGNKYFMADYPRNDSLVDEDIRTKVRDEHDLHGKQVIAYLPTWRGKARFADIEGQAETLKAILDSLDKELTDEEVFYVNLHFLLGDVLDYSGYSHIKPFPGEYETYDFLAACDVLVTDYSSVMFDFAVTRRKIVLYPYDLDEYLSDVGTYIPYESLPFPVANTSAELAELVSSRSHEPYDEFYDTYCAYHTGHTSRDLLETVCLKEQNLTAQDNDRFSPVKLAYVRTFANNLVRTTIRAEIDREWSEDSLLAFIGRYTKRNLAFVKDLPENVEFLAITASKNLTRSQKLVNALSNRIPAVRRATYPSMKPVYAKEESRLIPGVSIDSVVSYAPSDDYLHLLLGTLPCKKEATIRYSTLPRTRKRKVYDILKTGSFDIIEGDSLPLSVYPEDALRTYYNRSSNGRLLTRHDVIRPDGVTLRGLIHIHIPEHLDPSNLSLILAGGREIGTLTPLVSHRTAHLMSYELNYDLADADQLSITNQIYMSYLAEDGRGIRVRVRYNRINGRRSAAKHRHLMIDEKGDTTLYFRQGAKNFIVLSSRKTNPTDYLANRVRLEAAYLLSRWPFKHKSIVLYEKMSSRYEESASVVYERLIDMGIKRAYYILDKDSYDHLDIDEKYKKNIVIKNSLKHYYLFFAATSFIGTETIPHCIEIRTDNRKIRARLKDPTLNYVFLQHGVMYMVSLDSASRSFFRPRRTTTGLYRVVTSSQLEKRHFVERGRYNPELLYVCGLPKYDRNQWYDTANKILVMLTWRPWEENTARLDFENTGYYQLMKEIIESVPENLRDKVILITHPLFQQYLEGKEYPLKKYVDTATSYDELLRDTKVLITDYSSIAYDAFYRGANVLFYWKDKDECMEAYGEGTELMINEDNVFGDTCYQVDELSETLERNYWSGHSPEHEKRYKRIVEFHDGKNTDRLVEFLKEDGII